MTITYPALDAPQGRAILAQDLRGWTGRAMFCPISRRALDISRTIEVCLWRGDALASQLLLDPRGLSSLGGILGLLERASYRAHELEEAGDLATEGLRAEICDGRWWRWRGRTATWRGERPGTCGPRALSEARIARAEAERAAADHASFLSRQGVLL